MNKLFFIINDLEGGGAEKVTVEYVNNLVETYDVTLFLLKNSGVHLKAVDAKVKIVYALHKEEKLSKNMGKVIMRALKYSKNMDTVIGALEFIPTYIAFFIGKIRRIPTVGWVHTNLNVNTSIYNKWDVKISRFIYNRLSRIISVSEGVKESIVDVFKIKNAQNIITIYNPFNLDKIIKLSCEKDEIVEESTPYILAVGRLIPEKGFDILIDAFKELKKDTSFTKKLIILGEGPEGDKLKEQVKNLRLEENVFLIGYKENPYTWIKNADLFVLSSRLEGLPSVLIEALILQTSIVSFDCLSGPSEILEDGEYGVLVKNINYNDLSEKIKFALSKDNQLKISSEKMRIRANEFTTLKSISKFEKVLSQL
ncbi:glycosyltransferase [Bacillus mobilis]|uniref:glycosyltransferase n=1 Tax=Bacillus mobilis TaxID=2026190 RepID=UPI0022E6B97E|nr:glycosyltransferase [Bacillus mobilis]